MLHLVHSTLVFFCVVLRLTLPFSSALGAGPDCAASMGTLLSSREQFETITRRWKIDIDLAPELKSRLSRGVNTQTDELKQFEKKVRAGMRDFFVETAYAGFQAMERINPDAVRQALRTACEQPARFHIPSPQADSLGYTNGFSHIISLPKISHGRLAWFSFTWGNPHLFFDQTTYDQILEHILTEKELLRWQPTARFVALANSARDRAKATPPGESPEFENAFNFVRVADLMFARNTIFHELLHAVSVPMLVIHDQVDCSNPSFQNDPVYACAAQVFPGTVVAPADPADCGRGEIYALSSYGMTSALGCATCASLVVSKGQILPPDRIPLPETFPQCADADDGPRFDPVAYRTACSVIGCGS